MCAAGVKYTKKVPWKCEVRDPGWPIPHLLPPWAKHHGRKGPSCRGRAVCSMQGETRPSKYQIKIVA